MEGVEERGGRGMRRGREGREGRVRGGRGDVLGDQLIAASRPTTRLACQYIACDSEHRAVWPKYLVIARTPHSSCKVFTTRSPLSWGTAGERPSLFSIDFHYLSRYGQTRGPRCPRAVTSGNVRAPVTVICRIDDGAWVSSRLA